MRCDLHLHSTLSDGGMPIADLAALARRRLDCWALTDHDTLAGARALRHEPGIVPGVEITTESPHWHGEVHVVALGVNLDDAAFEDFLAGIRATRRTRIAAIIAHVNSQAGTTLRLDQVQPADAQVVTRQHLATALRHANAASDWQAASQWIGDSALRAAGIALPPYPDLTVAIAAVHAAGGVALLAHPVVYGDMTVICHLLDAGLDGLELAHPRCPGSLRKALSAEALRRNLLVSAGSDLHHPTRELRTGDVRLPRQRLQPLLDRLGWREPAA